MMAKAALRPALARLSQSVQDQRTSQPARCIVGVIFAVTVGGAVDGDDLVAVTIGADVLPAAYDKDAYAAGGWAAGDAVAVLLNGSSPLILCRLGGLPIP